MLNEVRYENQQYKQQIELLKNRLDNPTFWEWGYNKINEIKNSAKVQHLQSIGLIPFLWLLFKMKSIARLGKFIDHSLYTVYNRSVVAQFVRKTKSIVDSLYSWFNKGKDELNEEIIDHTYNPEETEKFVEQVKDKLENELIAMNQCQDLIKKNVDHMLLDKDPYKLMQFCLETADVLNENVKECLTNMYSSFVHFRCLNPDLFNKLVDQNVYRDLAAYFNDGDQSSWHLYTTSLDAPENICSERILQAINYPKRHFYSRGYKYPNLVYDDDSTNYEMPEELYEYVKDIPMFKKIGYTKQNKIQQILDDIAANNAANPIMPNNTNYNATNALPFNGTVYNSILGILSSIAAILTPIFYARSRNNTQEPAETKFPRMHGNPDIESNPREVNENSEFTYHDQSTEYEI